MFHLSCVELFKCVYSLSSRFIYCSLERAIFYFYFIIVVIAPARRAGDPGSIPGPGENFSLKIINI